MRTADGSRITELTTSHSGPAFMVSFELASGTYVDIDLVAAFSFEPQNFKKFPGKYVDPSLKIIPVKLPSAKWLFLYV
jgi:hypothetical protein